MKSVTVKITFRGGSWSARAGRGAKAKNASSTSDAETAAQRAAAKWFGIDECNLLRPDDLTVRGLGSAHGTEMQEVTVTMPYDLTPWERAALEAVRGVGAVFSPALARIILALSKLDPALVVITETEEKDSAGTKPFFKAQVTAAGHAALKVGAL